MLKSWELDKVESALNAHLNSFITVPVVWDNEGNPDGGPMDPPDGLYCEQYMLPGQGTTIELGTHGKHRNVGVYQITIVGEMYKGKKELGDQVSELLQGFKPGTRVTHVDGTVLVTNSSSAQGFPEGERYRLPVNIFWQADTITE